MDYLNYVLDLDSKQKYKFVAHLFKTIDAKLVQKLLRKKLSEDKTNKDSVLNILGYFMRTYQFLVKR